MGDVDQPESGQIEGADERWPGVVSTAMHAAIVRQLVRDVEGRLLDPLDRLLSPSGGRSETSVALRRRVEADAEMWAAQVAGPDERLAEATARRIVAEVYQAGDVFAPPYTWWRTPFGSLVARRFGHPTATAVSLAVASAILGITRQGVHDLVKRGKLRRGEEAGGVLVDSVRERLALVPAAVLWAEITSAGDENGLDSDGVYGNAVGIVGG